MLQRTSNSNVVCCSDLLTSACRSTIHQIISFIPVDSASGSFTDCKMISVMYLTLLVYAITETKVTPFELASTGEACGNTENVYERLQLAEKMITSEKVRVSSVTLLSLIQDCEDVLNYGQKYSGVYLVWPKNRIISGPISVYCDMQTDGGGWTVIQRRGNFSRAKDNFYKDWKSYKEGFGNLKEDFWLGNDNIYALSNQKRYSIRFDLRDFEGNKAYALYSSFWIDDEIHNYTLHTEGYSGNAGDSFSPHNGMQFTTRDRKNDHGTTNCGEHCKGSWWFNKCHNSHLNGLYYTEKPKKDCEGIVWELWKGNFESLESTEMKIRKAPSWIK